MDVKWGLLEGVEQGTVAEVMHENVRMKPSTFYDNFKMNNNNKIP